MKINPQFPICIIFDASIWFVMQSIEGAADDAIKLILVNPIKFDPLTMLNQFNNICSSANSVWKSACSISSKTQKGHDSWTIWNKLWMISRLIVKWNLNLPIFIFLNDWTNDVSGAVVVDVDEGFLWVYIPFSFLHSVKIYWILFDWLNSNGIFVFNTHKPLRIQQLYDIFEFGYG